VDSRGLGSEIELLPNAQKADQAGPQLRLRGTASVVIDSGRERPLTERLRHTHAMASQPSSSDRFSVAELTVRGAQSDLLEVDPLDFGPDAPATAALEVERGPEPRDMRQRGD
jgi:hypothetical protein